MRECSLRSGEERWIVIHHKNHFIRRRVWPSREASAADMSSHRASVKAHVIVETVRSADGGVMGASRESTPSKICVCRHGSCGSTHGLVRHAHLACPGGAGENVAPGHDLERRPLSLVPHRSCYTPAFRDRVRLDLISAASTEEHRPRRAACDRGCHLAIRASASDDGY